MEINMTKGKKPQKDKDKKKPSSDDLDSWFEDFNSFVQEVGEESDRAAVILGAAKIDQLLYHMLQQHPADAGVDPADLQIDFDQDAPLDS